MSDVFDYERDMRELERAIEQLPELALQAAEPAMNQTMLFLHGQIPEYPDQPGPGAPSPLRTRKQVRYFFGAVKRGEIPGWKWVIDEKGRGHPEGQYRRTLTLGRKFTTSVEQIENGVLGEIGTDVPYAPWVVGPAFPGEEIRGRMMFQARIHEDRWFRLGDVIVENVDAAWDIFTEEMLAGLEQAWPQGE
jgi:hypothetical protein